MVIREMMVAEVMSRWPETVSVFNSRGMACPGCSMAPFMTVAEAAEAYHADADEFAEALTMVARPGATSV